MFKLAATRLVPAALLVLAPLLAPSPARAKPDDKRFLGADVPAHEPRDRGVDVQHLDLAVKVDPQRRSVQGVATLSGRVVVAGAELLLNAVDLDIRQAAWIDGDRETPVSIGVADGRIRLRPPHSSAGSPFTLRIGYRATPSQGIYFSGPSRSEPDRPLHVHTQGEAIEARHWLPCPDDPDERLTWTVHATLPKGMSVLSNGRRLGVDRKGRRWTTTYEMDRPHPIYLLSLVAGPFVETVHRKARGARGRISTWSFARDRKRIARAARKLPAMMDFFTDFIGRPPAFSDYGQVFIDNFGASGMENVSLATLSRRALGDRRTDLEYPMDGLLAHELAHQWFGDLLTCRTWADIWLNESFATYFQKLWTAHDRGPDRFAEQMDRARMSANEHDNETYLRPIVSDRYHDPGELFDANSYPKGAWVLHMLREKLGHEAFRRGIRNYVRDHALQSVETDDLRRELERVSGLSLRGFFQQWVRRAGHPSLEVSIRWDGAHKVLRVAFEQRQRVTRQMPLYHLPIEVAVRSRGDSKVARLHTVMLEGKRAELTVPAPRRPEVIEIDPGMKLYAQWKMRAGPDVLAAIARFGRHPDVRLRAVRAMRGGAMSSSSAVRKLLEVLRRDRARAVRAAAARTLGEAPRRLATAALVRALSEDPEAMVRRSAAAGLYHSRDPAAWKALVRIAAKDPAYGVQAAALRALAFIDRERAKPVLRAALSRPSYRDRVRIAALQQLGRLADPADKPALLAAVAPDAHEHLQAGGALALAMFAARSESRPEREALRERLEALLHAPDARTRNAVGRALGTLGDPASRAALQAAADREPHRRWAERMRRNIERLGRGSSLRSRVRKLEEAIEKLQRQGRPEHKH